MASNFYDRILPDYGDLDNETGRCPGFTLGVRENDGGIGLYMGPSKEDPDHGSYYNAFLNPAEAEELVSALQQAISRARTKKGGLAHPRRVRR